MKPMKKHSLLIVLIGVIAAIFTLANPSEAGNALLFGLSAIRLSMLAVILLATAGFMFCSRLKMSSFCTVILCFTGAFAGGILFLGAFPPLIRNCFVNTLFDYGKVFLIWLLCYSGIAVSFFAHDENNCLKDHIGLLSVVAFAAVASVLEITPNLVNNLIETPVPSILFCAVLSVAGGIDLWLHVTDREPGKRKWVDALLLGLITFRVIRFTGMRMGRYATPPKAYWNELAEAFLKGRLYLEHPSGTHDLTLYNGQWYVPNPPLPALILIPFVLIFGNAAAVNMTVYSAAIAAFNAGLGYILLNRIGLSCRRSLWVILSFTFGSCCFWLATSGQMWFISQLLTVTFTILACLVIIEKGSPVLAGSMLGLAVLARPNVFTVYLCMLGIYLNQQENFPKIRWKETIIWCLKSGIPVVIAVAGLLWYNWIRFDDWFDFGYVTINGAEQILGDVQKYGMFHPHFLKTNIRVMLLDLPGVDFSGERFFLQPHVAGYSMFLMSPVLIYAFFGRKKDWRQIGARLSVLLTLALLLCYHNTGAEQIGYRYILDAAAPLLILIAEGYDGKREWIFKAFTIFSVMLSVCSMYWWYIAR